MTGPPELTTRELLERLPQPPQVSKPFLTEQSIAASARTQQDLDDLREMLSGHWLDGMLAGVLAALPDVQRVIGASGRSALSFKALPSNTINALTLPTRDGVVVVYNLGFCSFFATAATAFRIALSSEPQHGPVRAAQWLAMCVDWATSSVAEPRITLPADLPEDDGLAANLSLHAQKFALCHELGHVVDIARGVHESVELAAVAGVEVATLTSDWDREYDADRAALEMMVRVEASRDAPAIGALVGAEVFLNAAAMLAVSDARSTHPPPDERLARLRRQFTDQLGSTEWDGAATAVRDFFLTIRPAVRQQVDAQRREVAAELASIFARVGREHRTMSREQLIATARDVAHAAERSPGATLRTLGDQLSRPWTSEDTPESPSAERLLAYNASMNFEESIRATIPIRTTAP